MPSPTGYSNASAELAPGTVVAGFRIDRLIGRGSRATVYEATQLSLGRAVALKVLRDRSLAERVRRVSWPDHPAAVTLFGAGDSPYGPWLAMRLVRGATLETRRADLRPVAVALEHAHARGVVHGDVRARNVLVEDGRAYLSDFGLGPAGATAEDDRAALAALAPRHRAQRARRRLALAGGGGGLAMAAVIVALVTRGDEAPEPAPHVPAGLVPVGSDLAPRDVESVDCAGRAPGGASPACTMSQRTLDGRRVVAPVTGTITAWSVRGASGTLALQVLRGRGNRLLEVDRSADEEVAGPGLHRVRTQMAIAEGDRIALLVTPGAAVGLRAGRGAGLERWFGPVLEPARPPEQPTGTGLDRELLLRVDVRPGSAVPMIERLSGERAATAPAGRRVATREVDVGRGATRTVAVVVLGEAVAVDLFDGTRRLARAPLPGTDARGDLLELDAVRDTILVRWRNPDGRAANRRFAVSATALS
jgi:hypothetical protein